MNAIDSQRWQRASPYLDEVLDLPPGELAPWLAALRAEDSEIAEDVEAHRRHRPCAGADGPGRLPVPEEDR